MMGDDGACCRGLRHVPDDKMRSLMEIDGDGGLLVQYWSD